MGGNLGIDIPLDAGINTLFEYGGIWSVFYLEWALKESRDLVRPGTVKGSVSSNSIQD